MSSRHYTEEAEYAHDALGRPDMHTKRVCYKTNFLAEKGTDGVGRSAESFHKSCGSKTLEKW